MCYNMHHKKGDTMLKMSLNEIKGQIQIHPENWINIYSTNCYAYALGLDVGQFNICPYAYQPGTISEATIQLASEKTFFYDTLIENLENDLKVLGIDYKEVNPNYFVQEGEWKIALFTEKYFYDSEELLDFHFLREISNGIWFHKNGFKGLPSKRDYLGNIIIDPTTCRLEPYKYRKCYALKLKER